MKAPATTDSYPSRCILGVLAAAILLALPTRAAAQTVSSPLLAVEQPVTAGEWLRTHPQDTLQPQNAEHPFQSRTNIADCALATAPVQIGTLLLTRQVFFRNPEPAQMRLPPADSPDPNLIHHCLLSEVQLQSDSKSVAPQTSLAQIRDNLAKTLGPGQPFNADPRRPYTLWGSARWQAGTEWTQNGAHWIVAIDSQNNSTIAVGFVADIVPLSQATANRRKRDESQKISLASGLATASTLPQVDIEHLRQLLSDIGVQQRPDFPAIATFLVHWVDQARRLPPDREAAALVAADTLLARYPLSDNSAAIRAQLQNTGAAFQYDELGACYQYAHNWLRKALQIAPASPAGQQAFLILLNNSFDLGCCVSGDLFEQVIQQAPAYLTAHPQSPIRADILLALGDAYRDRIAVANGADGDPFGDAAKYKPQTAQALHEALHYYRAAIAASPESDAARQALMEAWSLAAGLPPFTTRFVRLYD